MIGTPRGRQTSKSLRVCSSMPLGASSTITALSTAGVQIVKTVRLLISLTLPCKIERRLIGYPREDLRQEFVTMFKRVHSKNVAHILFIFSASMFLTSCYSIFDPAPYNPQFDTTFFQSHPNATEFTTLPSAIANLNLLAIAYAEKGDSLMREQLLLDVPLLGLAAATVASGIYGGSKDLTLGLGLGSAGFAGTKLYFNPQTRFAAYNGAALALSCGASCSEPIKYDPDKRRSCGNSYNSSEPT
jgi:hypothetical protein